jgi:hypothetical protein
VGVSETLWGKIRGAAVSDYESSLLFTLMKEAADYSQVLIYFKQASHFHPKKTAIFE